VCVLWAMRTDLANADTLDTVIALLGAQFKEHRIALSLDDLSKAVRGLISDEGRGTLLVAHDPEPIGVAVLAYTWTLEHGGLVAWLDELFVLPEHRGRGIGRALLRRALEVAKEKGCRAVDLEVDSEHAEAERLYRREGFVSLPRRRWARRL
jgi:GNAT superfamily N-acetyltransferase